MISSSTFPERRLRLTSILLCILLAGLVALPGRAQGPSSRTLVPDPMHHYLLRSWSSADGVSGGRVRAIAQTPDGYLWLGTDHGLERFDGFTFEAVQPPRGVVAPIQQILSLTLDRSGTLWIYCRDSRLIRYAKGHFEVVLSQDQGEPSITSVAPAIDGGVLAVGLVRGLVHLSDQTIQPLPIHTTALLIAMAQAEDGRIWIGTREAGILTWKDGNVTPITEGIPDLKVNCVLPMENGTVWIGTDNGLALWDGHKVVVPSMPADMQHHQVLALAESRRHEIWVGTERGLLLYDGHNVHQITSSVHEAAITALFEDNEGNLWFGDGDKLDRIAETPILHYGVEQGLPEGRYGAVYADDRGRVWFAPLSGGLYWMRDGAVHQVTSAGLDRDAVYSIDGDQDSVWVGRRQGGLTRLRMEGEALVPTTWTTRNGLAEDSVFAVRVMHDGSVWAGTLTQGVSHYDDGRFTTFRRSDGLASNSITAIEEDQWHQLWIGTPEGLSRRDGSHWRTFEPRDGLPSPEITCLTADSSGTLWIGTLNGIAVTSHGEVQKLHLPTLEDPVRGIALDPQGRLWISSSSQLLSVQAAALLSGQVRPEQVLSYRPGDGLTVPGGGPRSRVVVSDRHGRVWLTTPDGLAATGGVRQEDLPDPIPQVRSIETDAGLIALAPEVQIPAGTRRLTVHYTGIYLRDPSRVRFRYQLENFDDSWSAPTSERSAVYTNLTPGTYRFRLMATNDNGVWVLSEAPLQIRVRPLLWQSWPFKIVFCASFLLIGIWIYRARIQFLISQANMRSEERLIERTAIARELHDTLLQSFHALILFFQMGVDQIPPSAPARRSLEDALRQSDDVMREGRERLMSLRATMASPELNRIFIAACETLAQLYPCEYSVRVEGDPRDMQAIAQEELAYLGREALGNAFRHANATRIEVWLYYKPDRFRILISDNGTGLPPEILRHGSPDGHWGLAGMRERARKIGATFHLHTRSGSGTLIDVKLDAPLIYESHARAAGMHWVGRCRSLWKHFLHLLPYSRARRRAMETTQRQATLHKESESTAQR